MQEAEEKRRLKEERLRKEQAKKDLEQKRLQVPAEQMFHPQYNELFGRTDGYEGYTFDDDVRALSMIPFVFVYPDLIAGASD